MGVGALRPWSCRAEAGVPPEPVGSASAPHDGLQALLSAAAQGRTGAVDALLADLHPRVRRYCRARFRPVEGSYDLADGIAQDTCIAVLLELRHYDLTDPPAEAFVHRILTSTAAAAGIPQPPADGSDPARAMLAELPDALSDVLMLRAVVGYGVEQTGRALGLSPAAVRFNQHRAARRLRGPDLDGPPLDLEQIRHVDALLGGLAAGEVPGSAELDARIEAERAAGAAGDAGALDDPEDALDRDTAWTTAMADLLAGLDMEPDVAERLRRVLAGRPLWALEAREYRQPPELADAAALDLLVMPALPERPSPWPVRLLERYGPAMSAAAVAVLMVLGVSALISRDQLGGTSDAAVGASGSVVSRTLAARSASATVEQQAAAAIGRVVDAVQHGDRPRARRLLTEAKITVEKVPAQNRTRLRKQITVLEKKVAATPSPATTSAPTPSPTATGTPSPSATSPNATTTTPPPSPTPSTSTSTAAPSPTASATAPAAGGVAAPGSAAGSAAVAGAGAAAATAGG